MARPKAAPERQLATLRDRHIHCISVIDLRNDARRGAFREYDAKRLGGATCSHPEDGVCAAPTYSDEYVLRKIKERDETSDES